MAEQNTDKNNSTEKALAAAPVKKKKSPFMWILLIVFAALVLNAMRTPEKPQMSWMDYKTGIRTAAEQDKPLLISFYKADARMCKDMWSNTYANQSMIDFIESNFIPVMVDVDQEPDLTKEYDVGY